MGSSSLLNWPVGGNEMNKKQYLLLLKEKMEMYAKKNNLQTNSDVTLDWGELQFILSFISNAEEPELDLNLSFKKEQFSYTNAYWLYIKNLGLEEDFEYFMQGIKQIKLEVHP